MSDRWQSYIRQHLPELHVNPARESEIISELALQLEQAYRDALLTGASDEEAVSKTQAQFSDWDRLAREINAAEPTSIDPPERAGIFFGFLNDLRYATRFFGRNPLFAAVAVLTLAFGIGGNVAVFTLLDAMVLHGLPYPEPARLMAIDTTKAQQADIAPWTSALDFFDLRERTHAFSAVAGISPIWNVVLTGSGETERLESLYVSAAFFPILGAKAALGRTFLPDEDRGARPSNVVVLSDALWHRRFGGARDILGRSLAIDGGSYIVIGVLPPGFRYAGEPLAGTASEIDAWFPLSSNQLTPSQSRGLRFLKVIGRLKAGVTPQQASDDLHRIGSALAEQYPQTNRGFIMSAQPLSAETTARARPTMLLLLGAVGFVLLMACANVANLLLARAVSRRQEISVRVALGASRIRLVRQLLTEGLVLAAAGGAIGVLVASAALRLVIKIGPESLLQGRIIQLDPRALLFAAAAVLMCTLLAGLPPAWRVARADVGTAIRESGRNLTSGQHRLRSALVILQVAVALVLLVGSTLLIRSFTRLLDVDPGFNPHNLVTISTQVPASAQAPAQRAAIYNLIRDRLLDVPGVTNVATVSRLPLGSSNLGTWVFVEGKSIPGEPGVDVEYRSSTPSYFATMNIPLRAGRLFDDHDAAAPIVLVNETMARSFWPAENPVGKRIRLGADADRQPWLTVIGVVGDVHHIGLDTDPRPELYRPYAVSPQFAPILVIRTASDPKPLVSSMAAAVRSVDPSMPAYNVFLMDTLVDRSTAERRFVMLLLTGFASAALLLAVVGIYGVISQSVAQRTQEIGLRMALGASPAEALGLVFAQGFRLTAVGIAAGAMAAAGLTRLMRNLLFEVRPLDPVAFFAAAATLAAFALFACYVPARRATRVDPLIALRHD